MRIVLLVTAFNGLSQRAWCALREAGHDVGVLLATSAPDMIDGVRAADPELILCPFLTDRVPAQIWQHWRTVVIHPGPVGDRGPSSLDWAITEGARTWGVTAPAGGRGDGRRADLGHPHGRPAERAAAQVGAGRRAGRGRRDGMRLRGGGQGRRPVVRPGRGRPYADRGNPAPGSGR